MSTINRPARVGLITDQTGALSFMGIANVNLAKMVIDDINARGGLLGRPIELFVEDSATDDEVAEAAAARLVEREVDVVIGGIYSSTRQAIKGPVVDRAIDELGGAGGRNVVVGRTVLDEQLDLATEQAAAGVDVVDHHLGEVDVGDAHEGERAGLVGDEADPCRAIDRGAHRRLLTRRRSRAAVPLRACRGGRPS